MGFYEDMFKDDFLFDTDYKQRADIRRLQGMVTELGARSDPSIPLLHREVARLSLVCNALVEVLEQKGLATREELALLVQQFDLLDGREDGFQSKEAAKNAPRCTSCDHFVNPQREACIYCGQPIVRAQGGAEGPYRGGPPPSAPRGGPRLATCAKCGADVPQSDTFFTDDGQLVCSKCHG